jgi:poly(3-hydroxybutyrate) depolymerase
VLAGVAAVAAWAVLGALGVAAAVLVEPDWADDYPEALGWEQRSWDSGAVTRHWAVGVPDDLPPGRHPAIVSLHPLGDNRGRWAGETDLAAQAAAVGAISVVPEGLWGTWNAGQCCRPASTLDVDDVAFLDLVMADTVARDDVDPDRVYLVGLSNGGLMALEYLCEGAVTPAAVAAVAVVPWDAEGCDGSVPLLVSVGTDDEIFPFGGGRPPLLALATGHAARPWDEAAADLRRTWGCDPGTEAAVESFRRWTSPSEPLTTWRRETPGGCRSPLVLTTVEGTPHTWRWGGDWSHTREVLRFLGLGDG